MTRHAAVIGGQDAKNPPPPRHAERDHGAVSTETPPAKRQALLARLRTWMDTHTDQVIISGSLILGIWLLAHRQQPVPDPHLRHPQISMELS
jgi:hypothetical protein